MTLAARRALTAIAALVLGAGLAACTAGTGATPSPHTSSSSPSGASTSQAAPTSQSAATSDATSQAEESTAAGASLARFVGTWDGHTRRLVVHPDESGTEDSNAGCCTAAAYLTFHLSNASGDEHEGRATLTVTRVRAWDPSAFTPTHPAPRVGPQAVVHVRDGVITEPVTGLTYCDRSAMSHGRCGA